MDQEKNILWNPSNLNLCIFSDSAIKKASNLFSLHSNYSQSRWNSSKIDRQTLLDMFHENFKNNAKKEKESIKCYESFEKIEWILEGSR